MTFNHQGSFDASAASDVVSSQCQYVTRAATANSTLLAGDISGALDCVFANSTAAPGTLTTRTAAQMYADLTAELGFQPPNGFTYFLTIANPTGGTLTLAGGTGVTLSSAVSGATTVAQNTARDYVVQVVNPSTINIVALGAKNQ